MNYKHNYNTMQSRYLLKQARKSAWPKCSSNPRGNLWMSQQPMPKQEAPLTLRGQRGRCSNIKGNPKYMGASLTQGHAHFSSGCGFMVGGGKPELCTKLQVPSFSHCVNIEVKPPNIEELPCSGPRLPFLLRAILWWAWKTQAVYQI